MPSVEIVWFEDSQLPTSYEATIVNHNLEAHVYIQSPSRKIPKK